MFGQSEPVPCNLLAESLSYFRSVKISTLGLYSGLWTDYHQLAELALIFLGGGVGVGWWQRLPTPQKYKHSLTRDIDKVGVASPAEARTSYPKQRETITSGALCAKTLILPKESGGC